MATPSSTRYFTSSFVAILVVVAIFSVRPFFWNPNLLENLLVCVSCGHSVREDRLRLRARRQNSVKKQAQDGGGQFGGVRINTGLMPFIGPIHHPEEAEDGNAGVDARRKAFRSD